MQLDIIPVNKTKGGLHVHIMLFALLGLCFGSFANVLVYRLPLSIGITTPPSACPACKSPIRFYDLLPILSWAWLKGRCRHCSASISPRYPLVEASCALLFTGMALYAPIACAIVLSLFAFLLTSIALIDADTQHIPDVLLAVTCIIGVGWVAAGHFAPYFPKAPGFISAVLGILAGGLPLLAVDRLVLTLFKKDGFGYGDVKLMAVCGLFLGWQLVLVAFFFAFITGGMYAAYLLITGRAKRGQYIAFGPFLCAGTVAALWFGQVFISFIT